MKIKIATISLNGLLLGVTLFSCNDNSEKDIFKDNVKQ